jgi:hypothetical protein
LPPFFFSPVYSFFSCFHQERNFKITTKNTGIIKIEVRLLKVTIQVYKDMDVPSYKFAYRAVIYWGRRTNYTRIGISISGRVNMPRCHQKHNLQQNIGVNYGIGKNLL